MKPGSLHMRGPSSGARGWFAPWLAVWTAAVVAGCSRGAEDGPAESDGANSEPSAAVVAGEFEPGAPPAPVDQEARGASDAGAATASGRMGRGAKVGAPERPIVLVREVEFLTEGVVDRLTALSAQFQIRDFGGAKNAFSEDFRGHDPFAGAASEVQALPLSATSTRLDLSVAPEVDRDRFLAAWQERIGPWRRVEHVLLKVHGAEFENTKPPSWGRVEASLEVIGETQSGGRESLRGRMWLGVAYASAGAPEAHHGPDDGEALRGPARAWRICGWQQEELTVRRMDRPLFTDVTRSAGVAHEGLRFGQPGHDSDAWQGLAVADIDGDGWLDVFVPSSKRNFLYRNQGDGTFSEEAEERGLLGPGGGTGSVWFDYDGDGWVDLAVGFSALRRADRSVDTSPLRLFQNLGEGRFADRTESLGLDVVGPLSSLVAFDSRTSGWLDLFATAYGRMDVARNNSWIEATNGAPNHLLVNLEGRAFEDRTRAAGLWDTRWSYAAAAADFDRDGRQDLYVANNFGSNRLYHNRGEGQFADVAPKLGVDLRGNSMAALWDDLDGDGWLDLYVVGPESATGKRVLQRVERGLGASAEELRPMANGNALFLYRDGAFVSDPGAGPEEGAARDAGWAFGTVLADLDLDGRADIVCVNGFVTGDLPEDT